MRRRRVQQRQNQFGQKTNLERGDVRRRQPVFDSPVKRYKVELRCDEWMLDVNGLFRKDDVQPNRRTDMKIMRCNSHGYCQKERNTTEITT